MKILNQIWFTTFKGETIGIILAEDDITKEKKAYIGIGDGQNEEADIEEIKCHGSKVEVVAAKDLAKHLGILP